MMTRQDVFEMPFEKVYQCLVQKAERKGRTQEEVNPKSRIIRTQFHEAR